MFCDTVCYSVWWNEMISMKYGWSYSLLFCTLTKHFPDVYVGGALFINVFYDAGFNSFAWI